MIHLQIISRTGKQNNLQVLIRKAISERRIKSFSTSQVKGGVKITHKKYPGAIKLTPSDGLLLATIMCKNRSKEFQLLETFVGRLAYHFAEEVSAVNIQLPPG